MSRKSEKSVRQYQLDLKVKRSAVPDKTVVTFVDAATRELRRDAVERVKKSAIFALPKLKSP